MKTDRRMQKIRGVVQNRQSGLVVVLEDLFDPHNGMAVFRTCDAFGIQNVHLIFNEREPFDPKLFGKQSSSSANKWLDFTVHESTQACLTALKEDGFEIVGTALDSRSVEIFESDFKTSKLALMLGNESRGLSEAAVLMADRLVQIPMAGMVQSLNLSVTAAITLYEISRQRRESGQSYQLSGVQQDALVQSFVGR